MPEVVKGYLSKPVQVPVHNEAPSTATQREMQSNQKPSRQGWEGRFRGVGNKCVLGKKAREVYNPGVGQHHVAREARHRVGASSLFATSATSTVHSPEVCRGVDAMGRRGGSRSAQHSQLFVYSNGSRFHFCACVAGFEIRRTVRAMAPGPTAKSWRSPLESHLDSESCPACTQSSLPQADLTTLKISHSTG